MYILCPGGERHETVWRGTPDELCGVFRRLQSVHLRVRVYFAKRQKKDSSEDVPSLRLWLGDGGDGGGGGGGRWRGQAFVIH